MPNMWDANKAVFTRKCIALNLYIRKRKRAQINYLSIYYLKKEKQFKPNVSKRK